MIRPWWIFKCVAIGGGIYGLILLLQVLLVSEWFNYKMGFATNQQIEFIRTQSGDNVTRTEIKHSIKGSEWQETNTVTRYRTFCVRQTGWIIIDDGETYGVSKSGGMCA